MRIHIFFSIVLSLILTACAPQSKNKKEPYVNPLLLMQHGMTKEHVIAILGQPYTKKGYGKIEVYCYLITGGGNWVIRFDANGLLEVSKKHHGNSRCENFHHI